MSEWKDERQIKALNSFEYKLKNKDYEATLGVDKNSIKDDRLGAVQLRVNDMASKARQHPRKLFFEALVAGESDLCYDGQTFFSASHQDSEASGVQSNLYTQTGLTLAQIKDDIEKMEAQMRCFKDDVGEPYNEGELKLAIICHPDNVQKFRELNTLVTINNTTNGMRGRISLITNSCRMEGFGDKNHYVVADISPGVMPLIRQVRQAPEFDSLEDGTENGFMRKKWYYGVNSREVFGYGMWQKMILAKPA
jgi:phage major head subunit gpT-like protein